MSATGKNRGGPPLRNRNAVKSGVYSFLATGRYPRGASYVGRLVGQLRHALETVVFERDGEVSVYHAALIQSASRHEGRAQLLQRWLRELEKETNPDTKDSKPRTQSASIQERVAILREIGNATDARDRCLKSLGLNETPDEDDAWPTIAARNPNRASGNRQLPVDGACPSKALAAEASDKASDTASAVATTSDGSCTREACAKGPE